MNSFGLGLVLSFVDNATAGMTRATQAFNAMNGAAGQLTNRSAQVAAAGAQYAATGTALTIFGDTLMGAGSAILNFSKSVSDAVLEVGGNFFAFRTQLTALYGSGNAAEAVLSKIKTYAQETTFTVSDLLSSVTMMKAVGIEAMDDVTTSSGKATQNLLSYAADLAGMMPKLRNAYGTGASAAMGAFKEYIAEGNALTLKRSAGLDITGILGEAKGKTIAERTQQIADLIEKLNIVGYMDKLKGSPDNVISNLQDTWTNFLDDVNTSQGVWTNYYNTIGRLGKFVNDLTSDTGKYGAAVQVLGGYMNWLLGLVNKLIDVGEKVATWLTDWIEENPELVLGIMKVGTALGGFLLVGGAITKIIGLFMLLSRALSLLGLNATGVFRMIGLSAIKLLPLLAFTAFMKVAWDRNLFQIKQRVDWFFKALNLVFDVFTKENDGKGLLSDKQMDLAKQMGLDGFLKSIYMLKDRLKNFFDGFQIGFANAVTQIMLACDWFGWLGTKIQEAWNNVVNFLAEISGNEDWKAWSDAGQTVGKLVGWLAAAVLVGWGVMKVFSVVKNVVGMVGGAFRLVGGALSFLTSPLGLVILGIAALTAAFIWCYNNIAWFKTFVDQFAAGFVASIQKIKDLFIASWNRMMQGLQPVIDGFSKTGGSVQGLGDIVGAVFQFIMRMGAWLWAILVGVVNGIINAIAPVASAIMNIWNALLALFNSVSALFHGDFQGALNYFNQAWVYTFNAITDLFSGIAMFFAGIWDGIVTTFQGFGENIMGGLANGVAGAVQWVQEKIVGFFESIWNAVKAFFGIHSPSTTAASAGTQIMIGFWQGISQMVGTVITIVVGFFTGIWNKICEVFNNVTTWFSGVFSGAWTAVQGTWSTVTTFFTGIWDGIKAIFNAVVGYYSTIFTGAWNVIKQIFSDPGTFFTEVWNKITAVFMNVVTFYSEKFTAAWEAVKSAFTNPSEFFTGIWNSITAAFADPKKWFTDTFTGVWQTVCDLFGLDSIKQMGVDFITGFVNGVSDTVTTKIEEVKGFFGQIWQGVKDFFGIASPSTVASTAGGDLLAGFVNGIGDAIGGAVESVGAFFKQIWDAIANIFGWGGGNSGQTEEQKKSNEMGTQVVNGISSGLTGGQGDAEAAAKQVGEGMLNSFKTVFGITEGASTSPVAENIAKMIVDSMKTGFSSTEAGYFDPAAQAIVDALNTSLNNKFSVASAGAFGSAGTGATVFQSFGKVIIQGVVWGIEDNIGMIDTALSKVGDSSTLKVLTGDTDVLTSWKTLCSDILSTVTQLQTDIATKVSSIANTFENVTWKLPKIKLPKINVSWSTNAENIKIPSFSVTWNKKGAIFTNPTIFNTNKGMQGVGEAGAEAVLPLSSLWGEMTNRMRSVLSEAAQTGPVPSTAAVVESPSQTISRAVDNSVSTTNNTTSKTDNSTVFKEGSIVVQIKDASDSELKKAAKKLMKFIDREKQIKNIMSRKSSEEVYV